MYDLNDLRLFAIVAQAGGYAAASRRTGLPRATLSRRVAALETALSTRLIERSSRSFRLTDAGQTLYDRGRDVLALAEDAFAAVESDAREPRGAVRFSVPPSLLRLSLDRMVLDYLAAHPQVTIHVEATNRRVDLQREGLDFAIRVGDPADQPPNHVILPFVAVDHVLVVAPRLAGLVAPTLAETLARIQPLAWGGAGGPAKWRLREASGSLRTVDLSPRLTVEDMEMLRKAALDGLGIARMPRFLVAAALESGDLIPVEADLVPLQLPIHAVHLGQKGMRPAVRHLLDWLKGAYQHVC